MPMTDLNPYRVAERGSEKVILIWLRSIPGSLNKAQGIFDTTE
ncbi:MAG: hypothetical protein AB2693_19815 [Candidatus Thiodiazotropha sp.]